MFSLNYYYFELLQLLKLIISEFFYSFNSVSGNMVADSLIRGTVEYCRTVPSHVIAV